MKKMSIKTKLMSNTVPLALMILLLIVFMGAGEMNTLKEARQIYYEKLKVMSDQLLTLDRDFYQAQMGMDKVVQYREKGNDQFVQEGLSDYKENSKQVEEGFLAIRQILDEDPYLRDEFKAEGQERSCGEILDSSQNTFNTWKSGYNPETGEGNYGAQVPRFNSAREGINQLEDALEAYAPYLVLQLESKIKRTLWITIAIIFVVLAFIAYLTVIIIRYIRINVEKVADSMSHLANGEFVKVDEKNLGQDEIAQIIKNSNYLVDTLERIILDIKRIVEEVNRSSTELASTAEQISATTDGISEAVQGIAAGAVQQAEEIQSANLNVGRISDAVSKVRDNVDALEKTATEMHTESNGAVDQLGKLRQSASDMSSRITEITDRINATSAAVANINDKVAAITSIATQTNLLALNASIEAARAGDAGRGFAVVAEEIGKLADDSAGSADEIRKEMEKLLGQSGQAVKTAKEVQGTNETQQGVIHHTVESIDVLIDAIRTTVNGIESINESARQSEQAGQGVADVMASLSAISEENAASTEETGAAMEELNANINILSQSAEGLQRLSGQLAEDIAFFKN
ncbi:MAG: hypothetical protein K6E18_00640 [Lachnospiraceae bacterium]|nr:hypothetical protein [Lachnospiraceae bacterium]